jgi:putative FmdB family regulatory protein
MPTYEYHCPRCKATYDLRQSFSAETTHPCEECGTGTAKRVLHAPRVVFKGSGFYATDGRSRSTAVAEGATPSTPKPETKSDSGPGDASPEAAAAS